jgi:hypothetical protein
MSAELISKLRNLAERRRAHFLDLHESGRWKRYYNESEFAASEREAIQSADAWTRMAGPRAD